MKKTLKNEEMVRMLKQLEPLLSHKDMFGYVAARNTRIISNCLTEYNQTKNDLIDDDFYDFAFVILRRHHHVIHFRIDHGLAHNGKIYVRL